MNIGILSDCREFPTRVDFAGHGLGRYNALIAEGLAMRGHQVTLYGGAGSAARMCKVIVHDDETARAHDLIAQKAKHDVWLDGSHFFDFAKLTDDPVICRNVDTEGRPPRNAVFATKAHAAIMGYDADGATVIYDGVDVDNIPYNAGPRNGHVLWVGFKGAAWKRPKLAYDIAQAANCHIRLIGRGPMLDIPAPQWGAIPPPRLYKVMGRHAALLHPAERCSGAATITETNATGTPVVTFKDLGLYQESMEHGVTGYAVTSVDEAIESLKAIAAIKPQDCRAWVADNRSYKQMIDGYEAQLQRALDGEVW